jgi:hypothetical protein
MSAGESVRQCHGEIKNEETKAMVVIEYLQGKQLEIG